MADSLKVLQRIKKTELDELRRVLLGKIAKQDELKKKLQTLNEDYEKEKKFAAENPLICDFGSYTENYLKKKRALEKSIAGLEEEIAQLRDVMSDIFKEQKTYGIVDERRAAQKFKKSEAEEQKLLDEVGTNAYIKKHKSDN